jgi:hypothetical protein
MNGWRIRQRRDAYENVGRAEIAVHDGRLEGVQVSHSLGDIEGDAPPQSPRDLLILERRLQENRHQDERTYQ